MDAPRRIRSVHLLLLAGPRRPGRSGSPRPARHAPRRVWSSSTSSGPPDRHRPGPVQSRARIRPGSPKPSPAPARLRPDEPTRRGAGPARDQRQLAALMPAPWAGGREHLACRALRSQGRARACRGPGARAFEDCRPWPSNGGAELGPARPPLAREQLHAGEPPALASLGLEQAAEEWTASPEWEQGRSTTRSRPGCPGGECCSRSGRAVVVGRSRCGASAPRA